MEKVVKESKNVNLTKYGLKNVKVHWNMDAEELQKLIVEQGMGTETENGTLCVNTGKFTGRSPKDRFLVKDDYTADKEGVVLAVKRFSKEMQISPKIVGNKWILKKT